MPGDKDKIIVGAATLLVDGVDVGFTQGGVTFRKASDTLDVEADQLAGVARKNTTFERAFVSTTMLEATLTNMRKAMNEPAAQQGGSSLIFGSASPVVTEHTLTVTGVGPDETTRTFTFYRAVPSEEVEHPIGMRDGVSVIPITFELLKDPANNDHFGDVVEV